jgi:hypothetical protein
MFLVMWLFIPDFVPFVVGAILFKGLRLLSERKLERLMIPNAIL